MWQRRRDLIACGIMPKDERQGECGFERGYEEG